MNNQKAQRITKSFIKVKYCICPKGRHWAKGIFAGTMNNWNRITGYSKKPLSIICDYCGYRKKAFKEEKDDDIEESMMKKDFDKAASDETRRIVQTKIASKKTNLTKHAGSSPFEQGSTFGGNVNFDFE